MTSEHLRVAIEGLLDPWLYTSIIELSGRDDLSLLRIISLYLSLIHCRYVMHHTFDIYHIIWTLWYKDVLWSIWLEYRPSEGKVGIKVCHLYSQNYASTAGTFHIQVCKIWYDTYNMLAMWLKSRVGKLENLEGFTKTVLGWGIWICISNCILFNMELSNSSIFPTTCKTICRIWYASFHYSRDHFWRRS